MRQLICPDKIDTAQWLEVHDTAHRVGLRSNVTMMFGHVEGPRNWARHLLRAREQQLRSGGFTEFVPLPFVHMEAPIWRRGLARSGPTFGETLLVHAVARLVLHPEITNIQASWVKLGPEGVRGAPFGGGQRPGRDAHERVDLARRRLGARSGDATGADGSRHPLRRPPSPPAHDAVRPPARRPDASAPSARHRSPSRSIRRPARPDCALRGSSCARV